MTDAELKAALATAPELLECANCWEPQVRLIGNVRADSIALICRALLAAHAEIERMRPVYEAAKAWREHRRNWPGDVTVDLPLVVVIDAAREKGGE